jgi:hypothetical protein
MFLPDFQSEKETNKYFFAAVKVIEAARMRLMGQNLGNFGLKLFILNTIFFNNI